MITIVYLLAERLAIALRLRSASVVSQAKRTYRVKLGDIHISFHLLEELLPYLEVYVDRSYELVADFALKPEWCVLDAGANIGFFSIRAARICRDVWSFEPDPRAYNLLVLNLQNNSLRGQVYPQMLALGKERARGHINTSVALTTGNIVRLANDQLVHHESAQPIEIVPLDWFTSEYSVTHIDLLKMDVEGSELRVLQGATETLRRTDRIVLEYHEYLVPNVLSGVVDFLNTFGFVQVGKFPFEQGSVGLAYFSRA